MLCKFLLHVVLAGTTIASSRGLPSADQKERRQAQGQGQAFTGSSQDGLKQGNGTCKDNIIVYARGTLEPGNVGLFVGPPIFKAVADRVGESNLAVQGVDYPASLVGFRAGGDALGSITTASLVTQAVTQCPRSKVVMMGFSQGAMLMHNAAVALPANISAKVAAAVLFGDPCKLSCGNVSWKSRN